MEITYKLRNSDSSYNNSNIRFDPKNNSVNIDGNKFFTHEIIKVLNGINEIQNSNKDMTLNEIEVTINGLLNPPVVKDEEPGEANE